MKKIFNILKELSGVDNISPECKLQEDLALDSLCMITLLLELEDCFNIELKESDMNPYNLLTVQDIIGLVEKYCGEHYEEMC